MIACRFVGGDFSLVGDREFDAVGQQATFSEQGFKDVVFGGAAFIPEEDFLRIGFTEQELETYGPAGQRFNPPQSFCDKLGAAHQVYRDLKSRMLVQAQQVLAESAVA